MKTNKHNIPSLNDSKLVGSKQIFDGAILQLYVNQLELEPGIIVDREIIHHQEAVCVLATIDDQVLLVEQYRPAVAQTTIEVPAGLIDYLEDGPEEGLVAAKRELEEETGYHAQHWQFLYSFYPSPGFLDEKIYLYRANDLIKLDQPKAQDEHENVTASLYSRKEVKKLLSDGLIKDLKTLMALTYWLGE